MTLFEAIAILLTAVAVLGYLNHRFLRLPDTLGVTAVGVACSLLLTAVGSRHPDLVHWAKGFANSLNLSEVMFHGMLSVLLFAGSLHINIADLARQRLPVFVLATLGVILSTVFVGFGAFAMLHALGLHIALVNCLLFGALISPTDPIAVLGVLKTAGVPKALETSISGESLFNDGTGVVLFLVLLGLATGTAHPGLAGVAEMLALEVLGALALGAAVGYLAFFMLKGVDSYPLEILITLALATGGYSLAEHLRVSAPLAVVVMGLVIGNHGARSAMSQRTREHLFSFWELLDEVLNLVLFGLIGIKLVALSDSSGSWWAAALMVPVVLASRWLSVGIPSWMLRPLSPERTPHSVKVLTWGGLRGGISIALALSLPSFEGRETLVMATYAAVLFSLLVQAPTLGWLLHRLGVGSGTAGPAS